MTWNTMHLQSCMEILKIKKYIYRRFFNAQTKIMQNFYKYKHYKYEHLFSISDFGTHQNSEAQKNYAYLQL